MSLFQQIQKLATRDGVHVENVEGAPGHTLVKIDLGPAGWVYVSAHASMGAPMIGDEQVALVVVVELFGRELVRWRESLETDEVVEFLTGWL